MRLIVTDVAWSVRLCVLVSVCVFVGHNREPYKMAEPIEVSFGVWNYV